MNKQQILLSIIKNLEITLDSTIETAIQAKNMATSKESIAENKYDTRGLEASYVANGQSQRAVELKQNLLELKKMELKKFSATDNILLSCLVKVKINESKVCYLFLLPTGGGTKIQIDNLDLLVITPQSPIGKCILNKKIGDYFDLCIDANTMEYEILEIS